MRFPNYRGNESFVRFLHFKDELVTFDQAYVAFGVTGDHILIGLIYGQTEHPAFEAFDLSHGRLGLHVPEPDRFVP